MDGMARPIEITAAKIKAICKVIAAGNYQDAAARSAGVSVRTFQSWMKRGREEDKAGEKDTLFTQLLRAVHDAEAKAETLNVQRVLKAAQKNWKAAAWWLERKRRKKWGRNLRVDGHTTQTCKVLILDNTPGEEPFDPDSA